jgi:hypothetical protein
LCIPVRLGYVGIDNVGEIKITCPVRAQSKRLCNGVENTSAV